MPKKGYKPTEQHKQNLSIAHIGKKLSEETKLKMSLARKGIMPWNKNKEGHKPNYWKGKRRPIFTKQHKQNIKKGIKKMIEEKTGKKWKRITKEKINWQKNKRNRVIKRLQIDGQSHTYGEWETLKAQYGFTCPNCKKSELEIKLTIDHIIPLSKGGSDLIENIQPLCLRCNMVKHTKIIKYYF